jgi:hypothetical protein
MGLRRTSHEGSPGPQSPSLRHHGTQQWVDEYHQGEDPYAGIYQQIPGRDQYEEYSHAQQIYQEQLRQYHQQLEEYNKQYNQPQQSAETAPEQPQPDQQNQQQHSSLQSGVNSELYATITNKSPKAATRAPEPPPLPAQSHNGGESHSEPPPPPLPPQNEDEVLPPPPQFQVSKFVSRFKYTSTSFYFHSKMCVQLELTCVITEKFVFHTGVIKGKNRWRQRESIV